MATVGEEVLAHLAAQGGVTTTRRLQAMGVTPAQVDRLLTSGVLVRLRRSTFLDGDRWRTAQPWERHELRARAVAAAMCHGGSPFALSHHSALVLRGVGVYGVDDRVHLVRTDGRRGRSGTVVHVHPPALPRWVGEVDGIPAVLPELACLQVGAAFGIVSGLVSADSALRGGATDRAGLESARPYLVGPVTAPPSEPPPVPLPDLCTGIGHGGGL